MKKLLLHHCCAPCSPRVIEGFSGRFSLEGFWCNPNIHPHDEYVLRKDALASLLAAKNIPLHDGPAMAEGSWCAVAGPDKPRRCAFCYHLRMAATAARAKDLGISHFSTTLLSSPYQDHDLVREAGTRAAAGAGLTFVYEDFRPQFYAGKDEAKKAGLYMQKYCGCIFSREERFAEKKAKVKR